MKLQIPAPTHMFLLCLFLSFLFSCSKDSDLLAEAILPGGIDIGRVAIDDRFFLAKSNGSVILDIIGNDNIQEQEEAIIENTSTPTHGSVAINEDNTVTYTPDPEVDEGEDSFTYTITTTSGNSGTGTVRISLSEKNNDLGELKAFPGAEGFGKNATGGRGGRVIEVTNLNDSGPGSLRAAVETTGRRTVVFKVSGTIECKDYLSISENQGNLTIAGQTAPGDGITIKGAELRIAASNVIVRYLRIRPGEATTGTNEDGIRIIAFGGRRTENVIIDHTSITWGKDEIMEIGGIGTGSNVRNVTVQNSIIGENISSNHKFGLILWNDAKNISIYQNLFIHNSERNIRSSTCTSNFEMINNVVYSFRAGTVPTYENHFDIIGNVYKSNPKLVPMSNPITLTASLNNCPFGKVSATKAHITNNLFDNKSFSIRSEILPYLSTNRIFNSGIVAEKASSVEEIVLNSVGANKPIRDAVDLRLVNETRTRTGNLTGKSGALTSYPQIQQITRPGSYDKDGDGIEDAWELANGLDPNNPNDGKTVRSGMLYTNLEIFLHMLTL